MKRPGNLLLALGFALALCGGAVPALADGGITFSEVAASVGIDYERVPSPRLQERDDIFANQIPIPFALFTTTLAESPDKPYGAPGVGLVDYDGDGDIDIYVPNGPGAPNSLFSNQLVETGSLSFVDVAQAAGVEGTASDATGVCFGDINNDGHEDIYVVGTGDPYLLFLNNGNGTFTDITTPVIDGSGRHASACTMLDANNDGLLDIVVGNTWDDWGNRRPSTLIGPHYPGLEHNFLFVNQGGSPPAFVDMSAASGIENVSNMNGLGGFSWAIGSYDYDQDGDTDIISADNQGAVATNLSEERGWNRVFENDGQGNFTDKTLALGLNIEGGWMGLAFGDFNCDGHLDFFSTNFGDFISPWRSTFFSYDGSSFQVLGPNILTPFGWGASAFDYDNDGDLDLIYHGSVDRFDFIAADNPGVLHLNQGLCSGNFSVDPNIYANSTVDHRTRNTQGVATGDLNDDGFPDIVTVSPFNWTPNRFFFNFVATGSPLDQLLPSIQFILVPRNAQQAWFLLNPTIVRQMGTVTLEISDAANGNNWIKVRTRGSIGTLANGAVNRDGIGAVVSFTPKNGPTVRRPVDGGSSYASQNALELGFGLGLEEKGELEILWPGGVRNSLRWVHAGERVLLPEIPCSYTTTTMDFQQYHACVTDALDGLIGKGVLPEEERGRFLSSAIDAYHENH